MTTVAFIVHLHGQAKYLVTIEISKVHFNKILNLWVFTLEFSWAIALYDGKRSNPVNKWLYPLDMLKITDIPNILTVLYQLLAKLQYDPIHFPSI